MSNSDISYILLYFAIGYNWIGDIINASRINFIILGAIISIWRKLDTRNYLSSDTAKTNNKVIFSNGSLYHETFNSANRP